MNRVFLTGSMLALAAAAPAAIITQWDFNFGGDNSFATGTTNPAIGAGTAMLIGGVTSTWASGDVNGGSSDPNVGDDSAWNLTTWAPQGTESGLRGAQFAASTAGYENVVVTWDNRHSNTSSRYLQFQYSTDGTNFSSAGLAGNGLFFATAGDTWYNQRSVDLSSISGVANNPNFAFRVVTVFDPAVGTAYSASNSSSTYGTAGTIRFDMVTIQGTALATASIAGQVSFGDRFGNFPTSVNIDFENLDNTIAFTAVNVAVDSMGNFSTSDLPPVAGTYLVSIKRAPWLRRTIGPYNTGSSHSGLLFSLVNGDIDGDNEVAIGDYAQLSTAFGAEPGDPNWNESADLNGDDAVDIGDFAVLSANFGIEGDN
ncbi:MAG TPA: hypothetical protein PLL78_00930 [Fimbriimonadaceae bacterium]|nr:hypothetical protein [Fimbriimonadaceae bacterium]HRJ95226.1 hypothetical protein [Fimbriimonadaceae bacterium]